MRILDMMRQQLANERYLSINPGLILGGTSVHYDEKSAQGMVFGKGNVVAKSAFARGDLRFLSQRARRQSQTKDVCTC